MGRGDYFRTVAAVKRRLDIAAMAVILSAALQHPFAGDVRVTPDAMVGVRDSLVQRLQERGIRPCLLPRED